MLEHPCRTSRQPGEGSFEAQRRILVEVCIRASGAASPSRPGTPALTRQQAVPDGCDNVGSDGWSSEVGSGGIKHRWNAVHPSLVLQMLHRPAAR